MYKKISHILLSIAGFALLSSCANNYQPPVQTAPTSIVKVKNESGLTTWMKLNVQSIDNKTIGFTLFSPTLRIHPGHHTLTIFANFNNGFFSNGPFEAIVDVDANFRVNETYFVQAEMKGSQVLIWITDSAGKKVSPIVAHSYYTSPS